MGRRRVLTLLTAAFLATACTASADPDDGDPPASASASEAVNETTEPDQEAAPEPAADPVDRTERDVLGTAAAIDRDDLQLEANRIERVGDGVLAFNWQIRNVSDQPANVNTLFGAAGVNVKGIWLGDGTRRAPALMDENDHCLCLNLMEKHDTIAPGAVKLYRSLHPDLGSDTVTVSPAGFEEIPDVPVVDATVAAVTTPGTSAVLVSAANPDVTLEIAPLERHDDVAVLRATVVNDSSAPFTPNMSRYATDMSYAGLLGTTGGVSFVTGDHHHRVLSTENDRCYCVSRATTPPGESRQLTWVYTAPADDIDHVTLYVPWFGAVPGLPVIDGEGALSLEFDGAAVEELAPSGDHRFRLIASIEEVEDDVVTRVIETGGDTTDVALASDVLFDFDSDQLRPEADPLVEDLVAMLEDAGELPGPVIVEGHTDAVGNPAYNVDLSQRRAERVRAALEERLARDDLVFETVGRGQDEPVADNNTEQGRQRNRRVTVKIPVQG